MHHGTSGSTPNIAVEDQTQHAVAAHAEQSINRTGMCQMAPAPSVRSINRTGTCQVAPAPSDRSIDRTATCQMVPALNEQFMDRNGPVSSCFTDNDEMKDEIIRGLRLDLERALSINDQRQSQSSKEEEMARLKRCLADTKETCLILLQALDRIQQQPQQPTSTTSEMEPLKSEVELSQRSIGALEAQLKDVLAMNLRWQRYNDQQEEKYQRLLQHNIELEQQAAAVEKDKHQSPLVGQQLSTVQQEQIDRVLMLQKQKVEIAEESRAQAEADTQNLRRYVAELERLLKQKDLVIAQTKLDVNDEMTMLRAQLHVFAEDFKTERLDRERAQETIEQLQREIATINHQHGPRRSPSFQSYNSAWPGGPLPSPHWRDSDSSMDTSNVFLVGRGPPVPSPGPTRDSVASSVPYDTAEDTLEELNLTLTEIKHSDNTKDITN